MSMKEERTVSLWMASGHGDIAKLIRPGLSENLTAEIVIIGAGISGLSAAYALSRAGKTVVVLDDGDIGGGNTARTTAHLSNVIDDRFTTLRRERGVDIARIAATSHGAAIDFIERVQAEEQIECGFKRVDGYLLLGDGDSESALDDEMDAAREAGLEVEKLPHPPAPLPAVPCLRFSNQAHFNPLAYIAGLAGAIERHGGRIFSGAHVTEIEDGVPVRIHITGGHLVMGATAIVATASPINDTVRLHTKMAPYRTYAVAGPIDPEALPDALIWDTKDPYHYIRLAEIEGTTYAIFGGEDHKTGQSESESGAVERLERWARAHYPIETIDHRWSGQVMETIDGLGLIGLNPGDHHVYVVTGDSGMGITHGTIAGILLPALIDTGEHAWKDAYDPARTPIGSAATFIAENANVAKQFIDFLTPSDVGSFDDIAIGEGAVMRHGVSKIAVFRDDRGKLHVRSAVCPHLGCIVQWNGLEKVWDCPCHGSQFAATGHVLHGPSTAPLPTVEDFNQDRNPNLTPEAKDADDGRRGGS